MFCQLPVLTCWGINLALGLPLGRPFKGFPKGGSTPSSISPDSWGMTGPWANGLFPWIHELTGPYLKTSLKNWCPSEPSLRSSMLPAFSAPLSELPWDSMAGLPLVGWVNFCCWAHYWELAGILQSDWLQSRLHQSHALLQPDSWLPQPQGLLASVGVKTSTPDISMASKERKLSICIEFLCKEIEFLCQELREGGA